jgi:hypothetical protein
MALGPVVLAAAILALVVIVLVRVVPVVRRGRFQVLDTQAGEGSESSLTDLLMRAQSEQTR